MPEEEVTTEEQNTQDAGTQAASATNPQGATANDDAQDEELTFETWFDQQDESTKTLLESHTRGLKSALESERSDRKTLAKQVKELSDKAGEGSALKEQLDKLNSEMENREMRAVFYEEAHKQKVVDLKAAFVIAKDSGLIDDRGRIDWDTFKTQHGYLIERQPTPRANAGNGTTAPQPSASTDMNALIRKAAGV